MQTSTATATAAHRFEGSLCVCCAHLEHHLVFLGSTCAEDNLRTIGIGLGVWFSGVCGDGRLMFEQVGGVG